MAQEKIYIGDGKEFGQYGTINGEIDLGQVVKSLIDQGADAKALASVFNTIHKEAENKDGFYVGVSKAEKTKGKKLLKLKITINERKNKEDKTHNIELNTWRPTQTAPGNSLDNAPDFGDGTDGLPF